MNMEITRIAITGFMASGKTSVAKALGELVGVSAIDLDAAVAKREEQEVPLIFHEKGEEYFRAVESECLSEVLNLNDHLIVSLGGGAWIVDSNRRLISDSGCTTVWLDTPLGVCWQRIRCDEDNAARPLVPNYFIAEKLFMQRRPVYELADIRISAGIFDSPHKIAASVKAGLEHLD
jgi:shikimate kinase